VTAEGSAAMEELKVSGDVQPSDYEVLIELYSAMKITLF